MRVKLVVKDPEKARARRQELIMMSPAFRNLPPRLLKKRLEVEPYPRVGDIWTSAEHECPFMYPNCRNCGDPGYAEACKAAGHCEQSGTAHGIAPDSIITKSGLELVPYE